MGSAEKTVAALIALACIVMLLRMALGQRRRQRWDQAMSHAWQAIQRRLKRVYRRQATKKQAEKATQEILQRLRQPVERRGNVITPKAFKRGNGHEPSSTEDEE